MNNEEYRIPIGLCKQAVMKFDSASSDIHEILEDEDLNEYERKIFQMISEYTSTFIAHIVNIVKQECGEEDFLQEEVPMDDIDQYPGDDIPIEDMSIE